MNTLAANIQTYRENAGLSLRELGRQSGVSSAMLCQIESGHVAAPSVFTVYRISQVLGVSIETLIGGSAPTFEPKRKRTICVTDAEFARVKEILDTA